MTRQRICSLSSRQTWIGSLASLLSLGWVFALQPVSAGSSGSTVASEPILFGVYAHIRSTEMFKKMEPFRDYLQEGLHRKGIRRAVALKIYSTYGDGIDALVRGEVDIVRFGPVSYVLVKEKNPHIRLLAMESNGGRKWFNGIISVPQESPVRALDQLQGKRIAFGSRRSTTGRYLAQAALVRVGVYSEDLEEHVYLGRHDKVAFAVASGIYDAGATNENTFHKYAASKGLRKIAEYPCVTKPWVAHQSMDTVLFEALQAILLELRDPLILKTIQREGLLAAQDSDYDLIREGMQLAREFDKESLTFAVYTSEKPSEVYRKVRPVLDVLEQMNARAGIGGRFRIKLYRTYDGAIDALVRGDADLGRLGPVSYVLAKERNPNIRLLARENNIERGNRGVFVVAGNSPMKTIGQLRGKTLAFGNRYSTTGRYLAQAMLVKAGIRAEDLAGYNYLGRHDRVVFAVAASNYDAGVVRESIYRKYRPTKKLKVIGQFEAPEKAWVVRMDLDDALFMVMQQTLLEIKDTTTLQALGQSGFVPVSDADYDIAREGMRVARYFEVPP